MYIYFECGKFCRSRAIVSLVSLVPSCHGAFVSISWVQFFFFFVGILWARNFFYRVFCGFEIFYSVYLVGLIFFLEVDFVIQRFSVVGYMSKRQKQKYRNTSQTTHSFLNRIKLKKYLNQCKSIKYIRKGFIY